LLAAGIFYTAAASVLLAVSIAAAEQARAEGRDSGIGNEQVTGLTTNCTAQFTGFTFLVKTTRDAAHDGAPAMMDAVVQGADVQRLLTERVSVTGMRCELPVSLMLASNHIFPSGFFSCQVSA
jgi:hypothetical protein